MAIENQLFTLGAKSDADRTKQAASRPERGDAETVVSKEVDESEDDELFTAGLADEGAGPDEEEDEDDEDEEDDDMDDEGDEEEEDGEQDEEDFTKGKDCQLYREMSLLGCGDEEAMEDIRNMYRDGKLSADEFEDDPDDSRDQGQLKQQSFLDKYMADETTMNEEDETEGSDDAMIGELVGKILNMASGATNTANESNDTDVMTEMECLGNNGVDTSVMDSQNCAPAVRLDLTSQLPSLLTNAVNTSRQRRCKRATDSKIVDIAAAGAIGQDTGAADDSADTLSKRASPLRRSRPKRGNSDK